MALRGDAGLASADWRPGLAFTRVDAEQSVFDGRRYSVWVANADGSAARKAAGRAHGGSLSADGRWLAFTRLPDPTKPDRRSLYLLNLATGSLRKIGAVYTDRWSPNGATLAIVDAEALSIVDPASGRRRRIVRSSNIGQISFSPDGRSLAYDRYNGRGGHAFRSDIFAVRLSDGSIRRLTRDGHSTTPVWGPRWIVFERLVWRGGLRHAGRLWLMRVDGSGRRFLARGAEGLRNGFPVFGLTPIALSRDGRRLLACQSFEFGCPRVTLTVPDGRRYGFPGLTSLERRRYASPVDLSDDGARVLLDVGSPHDDRNHGIYELPFAGGKLRLVARNATGADWRG